MTQHVEHVEKLNDTYNLHVHYFKMSNSKTMKAIVKVVVEDEREPIVEIVEHVGTHGPEAEKKLRTWVLHETGKIKNSLGLPY